MLKSFLAAAVLSSILASGAMATAPATNPPVLVKHPTALSQKATTENMLHHCKKHMHLVKGKCVAVKM